MFCKFNIVWQWWCIYLKKKTVNKKKKKTSQLKKPYPLLIKLFRSVWYMCLKIENCCLKIFVKIRVGEKVCRNAWNVVQKLKMVVWKYKPNTPFITLSLSEKTPSDTAIGRKGRRKKKPSDLFTSNSARRKKKPCATLEIRSVGHRHPLLSFSITFFSLSLSFSLWVFVVLIWFWNFPMILG